MTEEQERGHMAQALKARKEREQAKRSDRIIVPGLRSHPSG